MYDEKRLETSRELEIQGMMASKEVGKSGGDNETDLPVLIIGAGIGGLATAIALQKTGIPVRVFERVHEIKEVGAGLSLWANAIKVLQMLDLSEVIRDVAVPATSIEGFYSANGRPLTQLSPKAVEHLEKKIGIPMVAVHRAEFLAMLKEKVESGIITLGARLTSFEQDMDGVTAYFADGQQARGRLLVGADGIHSRVRQQLYPQSKPRYTGYTAWRGITSFANPQPIGELWGHGTRFGIVPLQKGRVYWYATRNAPEGEADGAEGRQKELLEIFQDWHPTVTTLLQKTSEDAILRNDIYDLDPLPRWGHGLVILLGDAAHAMAPNMGQGACQALEDAFSLTSSVCRFPAISEALQHYQRQRLTRANMIATSSRRIGEIAQWEHPLACWLRDRVLMRSSSRMLIKQLEQVVGYTFDSETIIVSGEQKNWAII